LPYPKRPVNVQVLQGHHCGFSQSICHSGSASISASVFGSTSPHRSLIFRNKAFRVLQKELPFQPEFFFLGLPLRLWSIHCSGSSMIRHRSLSCATSGFKGCAGAVSVPVATSPLSGGELASRTPSASCTFCVVASLLMDPIEVELFLGEALVRRERFRNVFRGHTVDSVSGGAACEAPNSLKRMAHPTGFEPVTSAFGE
jgi:hypothetical protein